MVEKNDKKQPIPDEETQREPIENMETMLGMGMDVTLNLSDTEVKKRKRAPTQAMPGMFSDSNSLAETIAFSASDKKKIAPTQEMAQMKKEFDISDSLVDQNDLILSPTEKGLSSTPEIPEVEIEKEIGRGGMGVVYQGLQPYLDRKVAVKLLKTALVVDEKSNFIERFEREAKILAKLSHSNIVTCYQAGITSARDCYIVMEFIEGPNLKQYIQRKGALEEIQAIYVLKMLAMALEYALENGIIHRDIKPENVLLQKLDTKSSSGRIREVAFSYNVKLVDLGLARPESKEPDMQLTAAGQIMGTPATMAPEQFDNPDAVDYRADIYGLGCVFYQMLSTQEAYPETNLTEIIHRKVAGASPDPGKHRDGLSEEACKLCTSLLQRKREDRPQSYEEIIEQCDRLLNKTAPSPSSAPVSSPEAPQKGLGKIIVAVVTILLILGVGYFYQSRSNADPVNKISKSTVDSDKKSLSEKKEESVATSKQEGPGIPLENIMWGKRESLFSNDFTRLLGWEKQVGPSNWGATDDTRGVFGNGIGRKSLPIESGAWRFSGSLLPLDTKTREAGVRIELADNTALALSVQILTSTIYNLSLVKFSKDEKPGIPKQRQVIKSMTFPRQGEGKIEYVITVNGSKVTFVVGPQILGETTISTLPNKISLYVNKAEAVLFPVLEIQRPLKK